MSNYGLELAFQALNIPFARAKVGDRHVLKMMHDQDYCLGGEASGHIICADRVTTGDGIVSALAILEALSQLAMTLSEAKAGMQKLPQVIVNVKLSTDQIQACNIDHHVDIQQAIAMSEKKLQGKGRVLLRPSGTEPLIRVMVEGKIVNL